VRVSLKIETGLKIAFKSPVSDQNAWRWGGAGEKKTGRTTQMAINGTGIATHLQDLPFVSGRPTFQNKLIRWSGSAKGGREFLGHLLDYEIRGALRYRRFLSVALVEASGEEAHISALLDLFRTSDEWIRYEGGQLALIMRETDSEAATTAIRRAMSQYGARIEFRMAVASYPTDGWNGGDLLRIAEERLSSSAELTPVAAPLKQIHGIGRTE